jgi:hypothetical protein
MIERTGYRVGLTVIIIIIVVVIIITVIVVVTILGDTGSTKRNLCLGCFPITDTLQFSTVVVVLIITASGDSDYRATSIPAAVWNVVLFHLGSDCDVAGEDETGESEELLGTHDD